MTFPAGSTGRSWLRPPRNHWLHAFGIVWVLAGGAGFWMLLNYEHAPGLPARAPEQWPAASEIERTPGLPMLIMLAHPQCPCTRASIDELALLMARAQGSVSAAVLFVAPKDLPDDWHRSDLWDRAAAIPGVTAVGDHDGQEARRFHAATSGQTLLYDAAGRLAFSGGITDARGHSGDNAGRAALLALLTTGRADLGTTPVFGCSLLGAAASERDTGIAGATREGEPACLQ